MKQRVTLYLESELWQAIRLYAVGHRLSASAFVEEIVYLRMMDTDAIDRVRELARDKTADEISTKMRTNSADNSDDPSDTAS